MLHVAAWPTERPAKSEIGKKKRVVEVLHGITGLKMLHLTGETQQVKFNARC